MRLSEFTSSAFKMRRFCCGFLPVRLPIDRKSMKQFGFSKDRSICNKGDVNYPFSSASGKFRNFITLCQIRTECKNTLWGPWGIAVTVGFLLAFGNLPPRSSSTRVADTMFIFSLRESACRKVWDTMVICACPGNISGPSADDGIRWRTEK